MLKHLLDRLSGKAPAGAKRSKEWPKVRAEHLKTHPFCAVCGGKKKVEVHHIRAFHSSPPELELEPKNLISLCESKKSGVNCHLSVGHTGDYKKINEEVVRDALYVNQRFFGGSQSS
jgi:5-methylcytosine-specific restriction enzyme A